MSIEKLSDQSQSIREIVPFAQILNDVIEHIKDNDAFRMYSYLCSKDRSWKVIKDWTAKVCGVGERKSKQCWSYLARCGLIQYVEIRNSEGKILKHDINVLLGYDFNPNEPFLNNKQTLNTTGAETAPLAKNHRCKNPPGGETTRVDFAPLLNKDITNKDQKQKQRESVSAKKQAPLPLDFEPSEKLADLLQDTEQKTSTPKSILLTKFKNLCRSKQKTSADWQAEFENFLLTERPSFPQAKAPAASQPSRPAMKDFTQERLDRERQEFLAAKNLSSPQGITHDPQGREFARDQSRSDGMRKAKDFLLQCHSVD